MSDEFDGLNATEKAGIGATLNRCRALAAKIANELRNKRPEHFVDKSSLADVHASLEHAADVLRSERRLYAICSRCKEAFLRLGSDCEGFGEFLTATPA
jgi:hypothetical protein